MNRQSTFWRHATALALATSLVVSLDACTDTPSEPTSDEVALLLSVQPSGGSVDVAIGTAVVITFDHAMATGMEAYAALHEGSPQGPVVAGAWEASKERTVLTFRPNTPLKRATTYVIHLGGGMAAANGHMVNLGARGLGMGGQWVGGAMMGGMGGGMGSVPSTMMGSGWRHPGNGSYGMAFTFKTAG